MNQQPAAKLRKVNRTLLKLSLTDTVPDVGPVLDKARQQVLDALRKIDPDSAKNPPPEEIDVAQFHTAAEGAGTLLIEKIQGREGGSRN